MPLVSVAIATIAAQLVCAGTGSRAFALLAGLALAELARWWGGGRWRNPALVLAIATAFAILATRTPSLPTGETDLGALLADSGRSRGDVAIEGRVVEVSKRDDGRARILVVADLLGAPQQRSVSGSMLLYVRANVPALTLGSRIGFRCQLRRISSFGNFSELDWPGWNARRGVFVSGFMWSGAEIRTLDASIADAPESRLSALRARIATVLAKGRGRGGGLAAALVTGDRSGLGREDIEAMTAAGLAHVLAISGLHLGLVGGALFALVRRGLLVTRWARDGFDVARPAALAGGCAVVGYALISGGGISVVRATLMAVLAGVSTWQGRRGSGLRALAAAALVISVALPGVASEAGFQLSFAAVAAIVAYAPRGSRLQGFWRTLAAVELSFLCWVVTAPIVAQHFGRVASYGAVATLATAPLATAAVGSGLIVALAVACGAPAAAIELAARAAAGIASCLLGAAHGFAGLPWAELRVVAPGVLLTLALSLLPLAPFARGRLPPRSVSLMVLSVAFLLVSLASWQRYRADVLDLYFLSVGQGDSAVLKLPGGRIAVVDTGPHGRGELVIAPFLRHLQVRRIDYLIISHAQEDHAGGASELAADFDIGEVWSAAGACGVASFDAFRSLRRGAGTKDVRVGADLPLPSRREAGWVLAGIWPREVSGDCADNDRSVVVRATYRGRSVLLAGDLEARGEAALIVAEQGSLDADVANAPHHGSRTSSTPAFVAAVSPEIVVASAGAGNRYGFPRTETVARYRDAGALVVSTADQGAVHVRIGADGSLRLRTALR